MDKCVFNYSNIKSSKKILIFSPHQDDEVFGCGGLLLKLTKKKDVDISVIYITNGERGTADTSPCKSLIEIRNNEAATVMMELGINKYEFLNYSDGFLVDEGNELKTSIKRIFHELNPDLVLFTHIEDEHMDHQTTGKIILDLVESYKNTVFVGYEVWSAISKPNMYIELSDYEYNKKLDLMNIYKSQLRVFDYKSVVISRLLKRGHDINTNYAESYMIYVD